MRQRTLGKAVSLRGTGLHSGQPVVLELEPMGPGSGIRFMRTPGYGPFALTPYRINDTVRCTSIMGDDGETIKTVEHLLAAIRLCGIDNILVKVDGVELPLADGSAASFLELIREAGVIEQDSEADVVSVPAPVAVTCGDRVVMALPYGGFRVTCIFTDEHGVLGTQAFDGSADCTDLRKEIGSARTIGFMKEIERLQAQGLALGGVLDSAVVIGDNGYVNEPRYADEPVRHKALDLVGDMACLGRINGHFVSIKGGHAMNNELARRLYDMTRN